MTAPCPLGASGREIAPPVLGGNVFGRAADKAASFAILDRFAELDGAMVDTADVQSSWVPGHRLALRKNQLGRLTAAGA